MKTLIDGVRDKLAYWLLNFVINILATKKYSKMINVMVGLGIEQLEARKPVNYEREFNRLKTRNFIK